MIVGVLRETAVNESRVALIPADARRLRSAGWTVVVERNAGGAVGFTDASYVRAGAVIVDDAAAVVARADVVLWVKPPRYELNSMPLRPGQVLVGFHDPVHRGAELERLSARGVVCFAYELAPRDSEIDALSAMSRVAGDVAYRAGRDLLADDVRKRPVRPLVLGCGPAGLAAVATAVAHGDEPPTVVGTRSAQEESAIRHGAKRFHTYPTHPRTAIRDLIATEKFDLVICAAARRGKPAPVLIDSAALAALGAGAVVVDLVAKAGGNCTATHPDRTIHLPNGVTITHRSNYPSNRAHEASHAYSTATTATVLRLGSEGGGRDQRWERAVVRA
ncbi:Rossmann-fold NAD(P)-binding domain-containing protein [Nocardia terpenica]|uniref:proton-translocating NAD(P)(+) transhydrogenase n=1 Tax=Nocardia terpenica TaxID=455432 RepID=A0A291RFM0_9NOCA|nr:hypothetical protein [Nocardia terpenica]ATL66100.1 hypothetical protein CRH09_07635 [Nocardia terpenica]